MINKPIKRKKIEVSNFSIKTFKKLLDYAKKMHAKLIFILILAVASTFLTIIGPSYVAKISQHISDGLASTIDLSAIATLAKFLLSIYIASALFAYIQNRLAVSLTLKISNQLRNDISIKINKVPISLFHRMSSGDILSRITNDVQILSQALSNSLPTILASLVQLLTCLFIMFATEWRMTLVAIGATVIGFSIMLLITSSSQKYFIAQQTSLGDLNGYIEEIYSGHSLIRILKAQNEVGNKFEELNRLVYEANRKAQFYSGLMQPLMVFVGNLGYVAVCIYGSHLAIGGKIEFGVIIAFIMYVRLFTSPLSQIAQGATQLQSALASGKRIFDFLEEEEMETEEGKISKLDNIKGDVEFKNIKFAYPDSPDKLIIKDFSMKIKAGEKIAIVGPTGAGKSTIVNLLMRFYEIKEGDIYIDGISINSMTRECLHDQFAMVLQDTWLFRGSLRENLVYNKKGISDDMIQKACNACGLEDFIEALPKGLDTELNENISVSEGQKQLITIARAMLQNSPMLILDEATSSVDTRTELITQKAMDKLSENKTSFVIAHRLSTIRNADLILVLKDGNIIEQGNHEELLALDGFYGHLYKSQFEKNL